MARGVLGRTLARVQPRPRLVDWSILALVAVELGSGLLSLTVGRPGGAVVFWVHSVVGLTLVALIGFKLHRVRRRVTDRRLWTSTTWLSVLTAVVALAALGTGIYWVLGGDFAVLAWNAMNVHILFGLLLLPLVLAHLYTRFRLPRRVDFGDRRAALQYAGLLVGGVAVWRAQSVANRLLDTAGATRRFTGSKPVGGDSDGDGDGDGFPVTSWVADDPDPIAVEEWRLRVDGLVGTPLVLRYDDLVSGAREPTTATATTTALLDCTSGWYTVQDWHGVRVGDLLASAELDADARWVRFVSVTGYRWSLPIADARDALLATHVGGRALSHGHGAPLRLVAPGRRGFQWVKWVTAVEVRDRRDLGEWIAIMVSGLDG